MFFLRDFEVLTKMLVSDSIIKFKRTKMKTITENCVHTSAASFSEASISVSFSCCAAFSRFSKSESKEEKYGKRKCKIRNAQK